MSTEHQHPDEKPERRSLLEPIAPEFQKAPGEAEAEAIQNTVQAALPPDPTRMATNLAHMDNTTRTQAVSRLQQQFGNAYVQRVMQERVVQRQPTPTPTPAPAPGAAPAPAPPAIPEDLRRFRERGIYGGAGGQTIAPSTGMGGFNAKYDANSMILTIIVNIEMTFVDGISINGSNFVANDGGLQRIVDSLNRTRGRARQRALDEVRANWQWPTSGGTGPENDPDQWMARYRSQIASAWQRRHTFRSTKPGWESQLANVDVQINTTKVIAGGGSAPGGAPSGAASPTHTRARILRTSDVVGAFPLVGGNVAGVGAEVGPGTAGSGTDQTLTLGSNQLLTPVQKLTHSVFFAEGSSSLSNDAKTALDNFIISFQAPPGQTGTTIDIVGRANTSGTPERNRQISQERAQAVADYLRTKQVRGQNLANATTRIQSTTGAGEAGAGEEGHWRRVEVTVAGGQVQNVAAHEFGHMIGLGDEYAVDVDAAGNPTGRGLIAGTGSNVGTATAHDTLSRNMGLGGSVHENSESVMSLGGTVRPQHYATFMEALRTVTSVSEWGLRT